MFYTLFFISLLIAWITVIFIIIAKKNEGAIFIIGLIVLGMTWLIGYSVLYAHCPESIKTVNIYPIIVDDKYIYTSMYVKDEEIYLSYFEKSESLLRKKEIRLRDSTFAEDSESYLLITGQVCDSEYFQDLANTKYEFHIDKDSLSIMYEEFNK